MQKEHAPGRVVPLGKHGLGNYDVSRGQGVTLQQSLTNIRHVCE